VECRKHGVVGAEIEVRGAGGVIVRYNIGINIVELLHRETLFFACWELPGICEV
jgi:hypothetical protein